MMVEVFHTFQGWAKFTDIWGSIGTYRGACSWFEVCAERPKSIIPADFEPLVDAEVVTENDASHCHRSRWKRITATGGGEVNANRSLTSKSEQKNTWDLQRNVHAGQDWKTHWVVWERHGPDSGPVNEDTGAGTGADFVRCLKPGDRINLVARAQVISLDLGCDVLLTSLPSSFLAGRTVSVVRKSMFTTQYDRIWFL